MDTVTLTLQSSLGIAANHAGIKNLGIKMMPLKTQWEAAMKINPGGRKDDSVNQQGLVDKTQIIN